jgi:radical SAM superfamily enzyme YgiQ (UPF0313 family)
MNVLLIYPKFPDTFWSFKYALSFIHKRSAFPPLGLLTVAALLPDEFQKRLVDVNVNGLTDDDLSWADLAFVSGMAVQRDSAKQIIARCKAKDLKVIAGGPLFTAEPEEFGEVDHLVLDEAELTLPSFLEDLKNGWSVRFPETMLMERPINIRTSLPEDMRIIYCLSLEECLTERGYKVIGWR